MLSIEEFYKKNPYWLLINDLEEYHFCFHNDIEKFKEEFKDNIYLEHDKECPDGFNFVSGLSDISDFANDYVAYPYRPHLVEEELSSLDDINKYIKDNTCMLVCKTKDIELIIRKPNEPDMQTCTIDKDNLIGGLCYLTVNSKIINSFGLDTKMFKTTDGVTIPCTVLSVTYINKFDYVPLGGKRGTKTLDKSSVRYLDLYFYKFDKNYAK